jgi:K+/H+ antiporter YhaU regulatory subunit KhtT
MAESTVLNIERRKACGNCRSIKEQVEHLVNLGESLADRMEKVEQSAEDIQELIGIWSQIEATAKTFQWVGKMIIWVGSIAAAASAVAFFLSR